MAVAAVDQGLDWQLTMSDHNNALSDKGFTGQRKSKCLVKFGPGCPDKDFLILSTCHAV
jgi:hypothetical protein